jgi:serine/threonine-protein kinase
MDDASLIGQLVSGRYRVLSVLGTGGMGRVYLAEHVAIQKRVALKVLHPEYSKRRDIVERFQQEAISASRIKHPGVLDVFDFGELEDGSSFIAMELLEGRDLGATLEKFGPLRPELAIEVLVQVCRALDAAHASGVVHRDLKPDNIFLQSGEAGHPTAKIVDFGIARLRDGEDLAQAPSAEAAGKEGSDGPKRRLTKTGMIFGTPEYMAPEQAQGREADHRSDVYAAGVILFESLTGAVPFTGSTFLEVLNRHVMFAIPHLRDVCPDLVVSQELERVLRRALAKDPAARFGSMREFAEALLSVPEGSTLNVGRDSAVWRARNTPVSAPLSSSTPTVAPSSAVTQMRGTPLTAAAEIPSEQKPKGLLLGGIAAFLAVAAAAGAYVGLRPKPPTDAARSSAGAAAAVVPAAPAAPAPSVAALEPERAPAPSAAPSSANPGEQPITLHVTSMPSGALVRKNGFQVCDATPCDVLSTPNESLVLTAELAGKRGEAKVLAQREQTVSITLKGAVAGRPTATSKPKTAATADGPKMCEVVVDGLKILRPCQ